MASLTSSESALIDTLVELVLARHRRLVARHAQATRRGRRPPRLPSIDEVLAEAERHVRADLGHDCAVLDVVAGELRIRLRRRLVPGPRWPDSSDAIQHGGR